MNQLKVKEDFYFDLSFIPENLPVFLKVGLKKYPLNKFTPQKLKALRAAKPGFELIPDENLTHYVSQIEVPAENPQLLYVVCPPKVLDAVLDTVLITTIYVPQKYHQTTVERWIAEDNPNIYKSNPKLQALGLEMTLAKSSEKILEVTNFTTALDAAIAIIFHHVEMITTVSAAAATVHHIINYSRNISDLALVILNQAKNHLKDPQNNQNWMYETPYLDVNLKPVTDKKWRRYKWSDTTKSKMPIPMQNALVETKNDLTLQSTTTKAGLYTIQDAKTVVSSTQSASSNLATNDTPNNEEAQFWNLNNLTPRHGFSMSDGPAISNGQFSISFTNNWLRWLSGYVEFLGPDGKPVVPNNWKTQVPGGLAGVWDGHLQKYVAVFSAVNTILAVPVGSSPTEICFPWPSNAASVKIMAGGIGRTHGIKGQNGQYYGSWDKQVCTFGAMMTGIFNLGLPTVTLALGVAISEGPLNELAAKIITPLLEAGTAIINGATSSAIAGGDTDTLMSIFADLIPRLLLDIGDLAAWMAAHVAEGATEAAIPIFGQIAEAVGVATDAALLVETIAEIASSPATFTFIASKSIDATWTLLPDEKKGGTWPPVATHYDVLATYKDGTTRKTTGTMPSTPSKTPITIKFGQQDANQRLPGGGQVKFTANLFSDTGWLAGRAESQWMDANISGNELTIPQMNITEFLVPLTASTQYQFKDNLVWDAANKSRKWSNAGGAPTGTISNLDGGNQGQNLGALVNITAKSTTNLAYSWQASGQNIPIAGKQNNYEGQLFTFQSFPIVTPAQGLQFVPAGFEAKALFMLDEYEQASQDKLTFWIDPRNEAYYLREAQLNGKAFNFSNTNSWGRFNQQIDAAAIHPAGYVAGINYVNSKLEILSLHLGSQEDSKSPISNMFSGYGNRSGLLHQPIAIAPMPTAGFIILQEADSTFKTNGEASLVAFGLAGNPAKIFSNGSSITPLKEEESPVHVLDIAIETKGFIYVLKYLNDGSKVSDYLLDIYSPKGDFISQTAGIAAGKMAVDIRRTIYTLNYQLLDKGGSGRTEPAVSMWLPSTPS